jgi:hypothetical protein
MSMSNGSADVWRTVRSSQPQPIVAECLTIGESLVRAGIYWLGTEAARLGFDGVIVVPSLADTRPLAAVIPTAMLADLVAGNVVRMNDQSLQLLVADEAMPQKRRHQVVLTVGLRGAELARVKRMNPAALFVIQDTIPARPMVTRSEPVVITPQP